LLFAWILWEQGLRLGRGVSTSRVFIAIRDGLLDHVEDFVTILFNSMRVLPEVVDVFMIDDALSCCCNVLCFVGWVHSGFSRARFL